ncbi:MAG: glycoside hydrolase family 3 C-terminal domain-containing protein [Cytophagaceae bacterium]|nr:glycoside hydrolase family 3 C-terminal domain-containing protein [Gemmatimonadaceae bacterium]
MKLRSTATFLLAACAGGVPASSAPTSAPTAPRTLDASSPASRAWSDSVMHTLSLRDKAAQLVWPWILGDYVPEGSAEWQRVSRLVTEDHVGGFIVSVGSPIEIAAKLNALQRLSKLPLVVSADLETGVGFRARGGFFVPNAIDLGGATNFPWQMALGAANDPALAYELGKVTAREGRALGIHIAYGPVLDVNNNPANPVIGARSVSEDPVLTARMGVQVVRGLQENGMLATGKHFPGHGDTETNSHLALATVAASRARLDSMELLPFREAIKAGVGAIMTFHGFLPALDSSGVPATLSREVMTGLLRDELRFDGLLVTDAMDMAGVVDKFGDLEAVKRAIAAGNDVLLMPQRISASIDAVVAGVSEGRYDEGRLDRSVRRVLDLKYRFGLSRERLVPLDGVRAVVGDPAHVAAADQLAERGFVLAKDSLNSVPLRIGGAKPRVLAVTYARRAELGAGTTFNAALARGATVQAQYINADDAAPDYSRATSAAAQSDVVVIGSYVNISSETATAEAPRAFVEFARQLVSTGKPVVVITFGTPYLLSQVPFTPAYAIAWGVTPSSQRAAARALLGEIPITAHLPISIPGLLRTGAGVQRARH